MSPRLRPSEWVLLAFSSYVAFISPFFAKRPHLRGGLAPFAALLAMFSALWLIAYLERGRSAVFIRVLRDWLPMLFTLLVFREMELFLPYAFSGQREAAWIRWDRLLLNHYGFRDAIESLGITIPLYLEFCYLLVYGVSAACVGILYGCGKRKTRSVDRFWVIYLVGTLAAYGLFPFFPSQPPRIAFSGLDNPSVMTWARRLNVYILSKATIHIGVFPSAHVSSVFACAWAMFALLPERKIIGWILLLYACSVSVATIYGRYHYAVDVISGIAVSLVAAVVAAILSKNKKAVSLSTHGQK